MAYGLLTYEAIKISVSYILILLSFDCNNILINKKDDKIVLSRVLIDEIMDLVKWVSIVFYYLKQKIYIYLFLNVTYPAIWLIVNSFIF